MSPYESVLWDQYLFKFRDYFEGFEYDVRVGEGQISPGVTNPVYVEAGMKLTQKRIDAVGKRTGEVWIYEVKANAGLSALGQLIAYRDLYVRQFVPQATMTLAIVTDFMNRDEEFLFVKQGIRIFLYPEAADVWAQMSL